MPAIWNQFFYPAVRDQDVAREIYLTSLGRISSSHDESYPTHGHPKEHLFTQRRGRKLNDFTCVWIEQGSGVVETASTGRIPFRAGHVLLLPPGHWHYYGPDAEIGWVERWICANGAYLHRLKAKGGFPSEPELRSIRQTKELTAAFDRLRAVVQPGSLHVAGLTLTCLALALGDHENLDKALPTPEQSVIEAAISFIWAHCHGEMSVDEVARYANVSRRSLERRFADAGNRTIAQEITMARLDRARSLLAQGTFNIKEVGHAAGFGGPKRFIEAYRRVFGTTPGSGSPLAARR